MAKGREGYKVRTIQCIVCGEERTDHLPPSQEHCSRECARVTAATKRRKGEDIPCHWCGTETYICRSRIEGSDSGRFFCSQDCQIAWQGRNKTEHTCKTCGDTFRWSPSRSKSYNITYCSLECRDADPARNEMLRRMCVEQQEVSPTSIERIGYGILDDLGIDYERQARIGGKFTVDAMIPAHDVAVEFDGDYWHGHLDKYNPEDERQQKRMRLDRSQTAYMEACGYTVLRFWGSTLREHPERVRHRLQPFAAPPQRALVLPGSGPTGA